MALAEERASSSRTCEREYSLTTDQLSGMRRRSTALAEERASLSRTSEREYSLGKEKEEDVEKRFIPHITSEVTHSLYFTTYNT